MKGRSSLGLTALLGDEVPCDSSLLYGGLAASSRVLSLGGDASTAGLGG